MKSGFMDPLTLLHSRNSVPQLTEPGPNDAQLEAMLKAAVRAPDHARLRPWRFLTITGDARQQLGELYAEAAAQRQAEQQGEVMSDEERAKLAAKALRAPLIIVVIATLSEHPKVPEVEQLLSAGSAAQNILLAAHAQGFGAIWRTGANAFDRRVLDGLGLADNERLVGYLYIGSPVAYKSLPELETDDFCQPWNP